MNLNWKHPGVVITAVAIIIAGILLINKVFADHLFGVQSGFDKARNGQTLQVYSEVVGLKTADVIAPWNNLATNAGRTTPLFKTTTNSLSADIKFVNDASTWVQVYPCSDYNCNYTLCVVHSNTTSTHTMRHEIGHCLGFGDHITASTNPASYINPKICDDPNNPNYSSYHGVMSYCDWNYELLRWFKNDDRQMLINRGYITQSSPAPSPSATPTPTSTPAPTPSPTPLPLPSPSPSPNPTPLPSPSPTPWYCKIWPQRCQ